MSWREKVIKKQQQQSKLIPGAWRLPEDLLQKLKARPDARLIQGRAVEEAAILTKEELLITDSPSALCLVEQLSTGNLSALAVTTAFCKRAAIAQQLTNCLTEIFFDDALVRARELDQYYQTHGKPIGPLHGLPISIKETFSVVGELTTDGWVAWLDHEPETTNSAIVDVLLRLGAILYCKTNLPQTCMTADSENNIFGKTLNPHNTALTAGGSSGGEGALISFRGSLLGVGTDIAGSIRIPALCCGLYGFKPTANRVPYGGQKNDVLEGLPGIQATAGPLAQSLDDIELFMQTVLTASPEDVDTTALAVPWRPVPSHDQRKLRIGVLVPDSNFPLHPPIRRTLDRAISALEQAGHNIINLSPQNTQISLASRLAMQYFTTGPGLTEDHFTGLNAEPAVTSVARGIAPFWAGGLPVDDRLDAYYKYSELHRVRTKLMDDWRKMWVEHQLDCIVGPGAQNTAVKHDTFGFPPYTVLYNVLDVSGVPSRCKQGAKALSVASSVDIC